MDENPDANETRCEQLAEHIKTIWAREYESFVHGHRAKAGSRFVSGPRWDGGEDAMGRKFKSVWVAAAKKLIEASKHTDVEHFVIAQFRMWKADTPPKPNILTGEQAFKTYEKFKAQCIPKLHAAFEAQKTQWEQAVFKRMFLYNEPWHQAAAFVLMDRTVGLSALYRYCMAYSKTKGEHSDRFKKIAQYWERDAEEQYKLDSNQYDAVWHDFIPQTFVDLT